MANRDQNQRESRSTSLREPRYNLRRSQSERLALAGRYFEEFRQALNLREHRYNLRLHRSRRLAVAEGVDMLHEPSARRQDESVRQQDGDTPEQDMELEISQDSDMYDDKAGVASSDDRLSACPTSIFKYVNSRQYGPVCATPFRLYDDVVASRLPLLLKEKEFSLGTMNKIFASQWLNSKQVVFGTKCNQLVVMDVTTGQMTFIPTLQSSQESTPAPQPCGIHGISINPSGTMLATGASYTNDIGIYKLPTFDPFCVGEGAHSDWVFDLEWIDDEFLITGSRDNNLALWRIDNVDESQTSRMSSLYVPEYAVKKPLVIKQCEKAQKVRALSINRKRQEMAVLSVNSFVHLWDIEKFKQVWSNRLTCGRENVCMAVSEEKHLYAVGSHAYVTLLDSRKRDCKPLHPTHRDRGLLFQGIRSLSFNKDIITIGTGMGLMLFYDVRAMRYLDSDHSRTHPVQLSVGSGWLRDDENYRDIFFGAIYPNAIYTHAYDSSGVRLFAAGGPLPAGLWGNYAALWV